MPGSFTYETQPTQLGRPADLVVAAIYTGGGESPWAVIPNIVPVSVQWFEGSRPPVARFRYSFAPALLGGNFPSRIEDVFPLDAATNNFVLASDDRVGIFRFSATGDVQILFDGFALSPQANISPQEEQATITAIGVPHREFDTPIGGAFMRMASDPAIPDFDRSTGLPSRFNPEGFPNATPDDTDHPDEHNFDSHIDDPRDGHSGEKIPFPVFLGPIPPQDQIQDEDLRVWTLDMAVRYLLAQANPKMTWVQWDPSNIDLEALKPANDGAPIDWSDQSTFSFQPVECDDIDVTGMCWPDAVERMIVPHGFRFRWMLDIDESLKPTWTIFFYRLDDTSNAKVLGLQKAGRALDPSQTNVQAMSLTRDSHAMITKAVVDMHPTLVECSFILALGFHVDVGDAAALAKFDLGDATCTGANRDKYRLFILDESGEGHYDIKGGAYVDPGPDAAPDLKKVFSTKAVYGETPPRAGVMVDRRRRPLSPVVTLDDETKEPFQARLHVSFDYGRTKPGTWDPDVEIPGYFPNKDGKNGTWDEVQSSCWELLDDRVGIRITSQEANQVHIGARDNWATYTAPFAGVIFPAQVNGELPLVEMLTSADGTNSWNQPVFMLTCAVEADTGPLVAADGKSSSPLKYDIQRRWDARHRFKRRVVSQFSYLSDQVNFAGKDEVLDDDTDEAKAMAYANLRAHQFTSFAGSVTIPRLTGVYLVGDKVLRVEGRNIDFNQAAGLQGGGSPVYPSVASVEYSFEDGQYTTLQLADQRAEYAPHRQHQKKPKFDSRA